MKIMKKKIKTNLTLKKKNSLKKLKIKWKKKVAIKKNS
jgi:hypothetical protein